MRHILVGAIVGLATAGGVLLVVLGPIWAYLYNDPCSGYSWDRVIGQVLITTSEPELCFRGGPRRTFTGTLEVSERWVAFAPDTDGAIDDKSWVPASLPLVLRRYLLDHMATPDKEGRARLRVQFVGSVLHPYPRLLGGRVAWLDGGPGDSVIYIERLTRVERNGRNPRSPASDPSVR